MSKRVQLTEDCLPSQIICEDHGGRKQWFIDGIFLQADVVNKNRRIYPVAILDEAVRAYNETYVTRSRGIGELNHPESVAVNLERISHRIVEIRKEGSDYYGKAQVLDTPTGKVLQKLLEGGVRVGVSSRGYGSTKPMRGGVEEVDSNYTIVAIDAVFHPSAPDALVTGLMEGAEYIWDRKNEDVMFLESIRADVLKANTSILEEQKIEAFKKFLDFIKK